MKPAYLFAIVWFISCSGKRTSEASPPLAIEHSKEVVCFVYHRFGDSRYPSTNIALDIFEAQLDYLVKNDYQVLTLSEAIAYLQSSEPARKTVVITVDDGYESFFLKGLPLLKKYNLPATLFVNTETVGGTDYMDWEQLGEVTHERIEIGNHTHTHAYFLNEPEATRYTSFRKEIELSQSLLTKNLGIKSRVLSYPYGEFDAQMEKVVKQAGFAGAVAQNSGVINDATNRYQLPRFPMSESYAALDKFSEKATMHPINVVSTSPNNFALTGDAKPVLKLVINRSDLRWPNLQCFVQGGDCRVTSSDNESANTVSITLQATKSISGRRRTLYTITVPDKNGNWHWYSHLWINPHVK